jgi:nucleoside-diphosphate-sugar epimerase
MRPQRTTAPGVVGVTGATTGLGRAFLARHQARPDGLQLVAVDADRDRPIPGVDTLVHLAMSYDPRADPAERARRNVHGTRRVLEEARAGGVRRVVLVTSVDVLAAPPGAPVPAPEALPLRAAPDSALTGDLLEVERLAGHAARTGVQVVVLRPACLVGGALGAAYDGAQLSALAGSRLLAVRGVEPLWQLCHTEDLLSALDVAVSTPLPGPAVVASAGWLGQREVEAMAGRRRLELPASVALSTAERLHRAGLTPGAPAELDRLLAPLVVEPGRLAAAGWAPGWSAADALRDHLATRPPPPARLGPSPAAAGATAAGATVALVGTAALVRRARRRRGR